MEIQNKENFIQLFCIDLLQNEGYENQNDPITRLISSYDEVNNILNLNKSEFFELKIIKYLYFNRTKIHSILYKEEEVINITKKINNFNIIFYLDLLIYDNIDIVNYSYSIDLIKEINNKQNVNNQNEDYKLVLTAKIIIELIKNHKEQSDDYNEEEDEELDKIENNNTLIIKNKISKFKEINLTEKEIIEKKIDEIYIQIINSIIGLQKLNDENYIIDIINQLDLQNINLTKKMLDNLNDFLKIQEIKKILETYKITNFLDFYKEKTINFYYILLNYIVKKPIYIYQIPFLLETRKNIIIIIKNELYQKSSNPNNNNLQKNKDKIKYIVNFLTDSEYYSKKFKNYMEQVITTINTQDNINSNSNNYNSYISSNNSFNNNNSNNNISNFINNNINNNNSINNNFNNNSIINNIINNNSINNNINNNNINNNNNNIINNNINDNNVNNNNIDNNNINDNNINNNINNNEVNNTNNNINNVIDYSGLNSLHMIGDREEIGRQVENEEEEEEIEEKKEGKIVNQDIERSFLDNHITIKNVMKKSEITFNVEGVESESDSNSIKDLLKNKCFFDIMVLPDGTGILYEKFKKPYNKNKNRKYNKNNLNILFSNYVKFIDFLENIRNIIINNIIDYHLYNLQLKIKLKIEDINELNENSLNNIFCKYTLSEKNFKEIDENEYEDKNILVEKNLENYELFLTDIIEIIYCIRISQEKKEKENLPNFSGISTISFKTSDYFISSTRGNINLIKIKFPKYKIIDFLSIKQSHKNSTEYIKELKDGTFISGGMDEKVIFYDSRFKELGDIKQPNFGFFEYEEEKKIVIFSRKELYKISYNNLSIANIINTDFNILNIVYLKYKAIFICTNEGILLLTDFMNSIMRAHKNIIYNKVYMGGIKINDKTVAFTSNRLLPNGEDQIIFYNMNTRKINIKQTIKGFSFTLSRNNLTLMDIPGEFDKTGNNIILLCACKKYLRGQKNGILLIKLEIINNNITKIDKEFYDTRNYEVFCFCQIFKVKDHFIFEEKIKKDHINVSEFILVGGFDQEKQQGILKLFKIIYNEKLDSIKLEYILDICPEKYVKFNSEYQLKAFNGFRGPITCIEQSINSETILISCSDGNIYLFRKPEIELLEKINKLSNIFGNN